PAAFVIRSQAVKLRFLASCSQQPSRFTTVRTQKLGLAAHYRLPSQLVLSGNKEWLEASIAPFHGCMIDDGMGNNNLDLLVLPQLERNPDESG
ncbi:hypothetical protein CUMW_205200, partial [Citrus unshiu]